MSFNFLFGDSIANPLLKHVLKINVRSSATKLDPDKNGASAGGATPKSVYNAMVKWKNSSYYTPMKDSVVVLSTGWSNAGAYYKKDNDFETYGQWNYIDLQFQFLKNEGAKVFVIGVYSPLNSSDTYINDTCAVVDFGWFVNAGESKTSDVVKKRIFNEYQKANKWLFDKCNSYGFVFEQHSGGNTLLSNNNKGGYYYNGMNGDLHPPVSSHWNSMKPYMPQMTEAWEEWNKTGKKEVEKEKEEGPTGSKWDLIFGDSIAAGIAKSALGLNRKAGGSGDPVSKDDKGASKVGANPDMILTYLKEFGEKNFDGKIVILSTGYSNGVNMKDTIKAQIKFLKDANAAVEIVGVSNTKTEGNDFLSQLASDNGFKFSGGFEPAEDGTHPKNYNYLDLWNTKVSKNLPVAPVKVPEDQKSEEEKKVEKSEEKSIFPILVSGSYKANSETELIGFQSYTGTDGSITKLGGMDDIVMAKLAEIYLMGYNPIPTKVDVTVDADDTQPTGGTVNWTVEINESKKEKDKGNGKAWVGFTSRGVSGQKTDKDAKALFLTRTDLHIPAVKTNLLGIDQLKPEGENYVTYKDTKIEVEIVKDVLYENPANIRNNIKNAFRQTFYRYTLEDGWPPTDKKADKTPTNDDKKATDNATQQQISGNLNLTISRPTRKWQIPPEFETGHPANRDIPTFHIFIGDETNLEGDGMTDFDYEEDYDKLDPEYLEVNDSIVGSGGPMVDPTKDWSSQKWEYEIGIMKEETAALEQSNPEVFGKSNNSDNSNIPLGDTVFNGNRIVLGGKMTKNFNDDEYVIKHFKSDVCDKFGIDYTRFLKQCDNYGIPRIIAMRQLAVESSFNESVIRNQKQSPAGAGGLCQFMPSTWQSHAKWDKTVFSNGVPLKGGYRGDPRVHLFGESTDGKIKNVDPPYFKFMSELIKKFNGRLDLALAGYNSGPNLEIYKKALKNNLAFPSLPHGTKGAVPNESYNYATNILHKGSYWPGGSQIT